MVPLLAIGFVYSFEAHKGPRGVRADVESLAFWLECQPGLR